MMSRPDRKKLFKKAFEIWGFELQMTVFMEECAELIKAISKYVRFHNKSAQVARDLVSDIADVEIMIEQLETMHDWENFRARIDQEKSDKLRRLKQILEEN